MASQTYCRKFFPASRDLGRKAARQAIWAWALGDIAPFDLREAVYFPPAPLTSPWAFVQVPPPPPMSSPKWKTIRVAPKAPRLAPPPRKVLPVGDFFNQPKPVLGFLFVDPTRSMREKIARTEALPPPSRPRFIFIAGVKCPQIKGTWKAYIRAQGESLRDWRRRVRGMVWARVEGRKLRAHERNLDLTPWEQLLLMTKRSNFTAFDGLEEQLLGGVSSSYVHKVGPSGQPKKQAKVKVPNTRHQLWCLENLMKKMRYERLRQDLLECRPRQRQRLRAVVLRDPFTHRVESLSSKLIKAFEAMVRKNPSAFLDDPKVAPEPHYVGQMDDDSKDAHGVSNTPITNQKGNVILEDKAGFSKSEALPHVPSSDDYSCFAARATPQTLDHYVERWMLIKEDTWLSSKGIGEELFKIDLMKDVLKLPRFQRSPNFLPFRNNTLWRGTINLQIKINSNCRQYGQLQGRFYYGEYYDKNAAARNNIYTGSQMPHVLINASTSNSGELSIPFEFYNPLMSITKGELTWDTPVDENTIANLGTFHILVVVPLTVAATTPKECTWSLLMSLSDCQFDGLVDSSLISGKIEADMFSMAKTFAMNELRNMLDDNRDNPTYVSSGHPMIPVNAGSWCIGNGLAEWTNPLRLDPTAITPYDQGRIPNVDEMKIDHVKQIFGMFKIVTWATQSRVGTMLYKFDAAPLFTMTDYPQIRVGDRSVAVDCIPPVGVLSSLFSWWRGSLKLRIDIVGPTEITGRLLVAYVPKWYKELPMDVARNCTHTVFDIQENRQLNFEIPFFSEKLFWERNKNLKDVYNMMPPPGTVYIYVFQSMIHNSTIPSDCKLILYLAGGKDFEVAVPALPTLATCYFPNIDKSQQSVGQVVSKPGYFPVYIGAWDHLISNECTVFRYGAVSQHIAQFICHNEALYSVCTIHDSNRDDSNKLAVTFQSNVKSYVLNLPIKYVIFFKNSGYIYGAPLLIQGPFAEAKRRFKEEIIKLRKFVGADYDIDLVSWKAWYDGIWNGWSWQDFNENFGKFASPQITWTEEDKYTGLCHFFTPTQYFSPRTPLRADTAGDFNPPKNEAQIDERTEQKTNMSAPLRTACGKKASVKVFGERFHDLKDLCRRYQLYASGAVGVTKVHQLHRVVVLKFPVLPQGLDLVTKDGDTVLQYWNRTREGIIPLVASGYRFFTGGIRFRLVIDALSDSGSALAGKVFVQHRPDVYMSDLKVEERSDKLIGTDDIEQPGYATYHQIDSLNNVICFSIPFYLPVVRSLLQRPKELLEKWHHLGQVAVGVTLPLAATNLSYELYYSLDDDARFSVFCGFPPMLDITNIPATEVQEESGNPPKVNILKGLTQATAYVKEASTSIRKTRFKIDTVKSLVEKSEILPKTNIQSSESEFEDVSYEAQMGVSDILNYIPGSGMFRAAEVVGKVDPDKVNAALDNVNEATSFFSQFKQTVTDHIPTFENLKTKISDYMAVIINLVTNFIHCIISFNLKHIIVAIVSIFTQLKLISFSVVDKLTSSLSRLFSVVTTNQFKEAVAAEAVVEPQPRIEGQMLEDELPFDIKDHLVEERNCTAAYLSTLIAGVAVTLAVGSKLANSDFKSIFYVLFDGIKNFAMTANHLYTFLKNNIICIQRIGNSLVDSTPRMKDIQFLKDQNDNIYSWALEAVELIDPWKEDELFVSLVKASRVYVLQCTGTLILLNLGSCKVSPQQFSVVSKIYDKLTSLKDRLVRAHKAPPIRFEPFIYELTGPTGVGKSQLLNEIPYKLLDYLNMKFKGEIIYHRALGNAYWNNCRNQPVCSIDEKFPIEGPGFGDVQLAELFQLKSRCIFNPPMADIPDKNLRYNPLIVQYASNNAFPSLAPVLDPEAVFRRRDMLIRVQFNSQTLEKYGHKPIIKHLTYADRRNYKCLEFWISDNQIDPCCSWSGPFTFEQLMERMKTTWFEYYRREEGNFRTHLARALSLAPDSNQTLSGFEKEWQGKCDLITGEDTIREFRDAYLTLLDEIKSKKETLPPDTISARRFMLVQKFFPPKGQDVLDDINDIKIKIAKLKSEYPKLAAEDHEKRLVKKIVEPNVEEPKPTTSKAVANMGFKSMNDDYQQIGDRLSELGSNICSHTLVWEMLNLSETASSVKFNKQHNHFSVPMEGIKNFCSGIDFNLNCCNFMKEAGSFTVTSNLNESEFQVPNLPCKDNKLCPFKDQLNRFKAMEIIVNSQPTLMGHFKSFQFNYLAPHLSEEYVQHLREGLKEPEDRIQMQEEVEEIKGWYEKAKESLMSIKWKKWFQRIACILGFLFFFGAIIKTFFIGAPVLGVNACTAAIQLAEAESFASGDYKPGAIKKETPRSVAIKTLRSLPEANMSTSTERDTQGALQRNTFFLSMYYEDKEFMIGRCLGISGNHALIVDHYWDTWKNFSKEHGCFDMHFISASNHIPTVCNLHFRELEYTRFENSSLGLLKLPIRFNAFRDIRRKIAPRAHHAYVNGRGVIVEARTGKGELAGNFQWNFYRTEFKMTPKIHVDGGKFYSEFYTGDCYKYLGFHGQGNCGSVLMGDGMNSPIIGIHVAGAREGLNYGFSEAIYRELFEHLPKETPPRAKSEFIAQMGENSSWFVDGEVIGIGKVNNRFAHRANEKSRIIPSKVQLDPESPFPVYTEVAVLSPKDPRIKGNSFSPMVEGCKHHGKPLLPFNQEDLREAIDDYKNLILAKCKPQRSKPGLLDRLTAINGVEGVQGFEHIEWNSSEGFPFVSLRPTTAHNKKWMFDFDSNGRCVGYNNLLRQALDKKWAQRSFGEVPETIFTDCLKDCRISKEKVLEPGKTRIFSISPVDFTIQQRQCTLDFVVAFMANRLNLEHAIGINTDSYEWATLAQNLLLKGDDVLTGDYSKFGDTIPTEIVHALFEIIIEWYKYHGELSEEHEKQLKIMPYEIGNSIHLMFDFLYQVICGQPSGNSLTVIINSFANSIYMRLAWLTIMRFTPYAGLEYFHKFVQIYSYGDDIIATLNKLIKELFNAESLHHFFAKYKLKFTNADKGDQIVKYVNLSQAEFLKRGFAEHPTRKVPQVFLAPLRVESIIDTVNWVNKDSFGLSDSMCQNFEEMSIQVCDDSLRTAFGRGPEFYENLRHQLTAFWRKYNINFIASKWEDIDHRVFSLEINLHPYMKNYPKPTPEN